MDNFQIPVAPPSPQVGVNVSIDDLQQKPQLYFAGSDIVWMLISSGLVLLMVPAMSLFYAGATNRQSSLKLFRLPIVTAALIGFEWYLWGYTMTFTPAVPPESPEISWYGGDTRGNALHDAIVRPTGAAGTKIPELLYAFYEGMFASFTAALVSGVAVRGGPHGYRDIPTGLFLVFITFWSLLVYNPVARWSWHWAGWSNQHGVMDFAGGTAVHITSGTAVFAFRVFYMLEIKGWKTCWGGFRRILLEQLKLTYEFCAAFVTQKPTLTLPPKNTIEDNNVDEHELNNMRTTAIDDLGRQDGLNQEYVQSSMAPQQFAPLELEPDTDIQPNDVNFMALGTCLLWIGWFGFNGGSALGGNLRAVSACVSTHVAACSGGITSLFLFWLQCAVVRYGKGDKTLKWSSVTYFCDGAVIGLVAITPAAGYVPVWSSGIIGVVSAIVIFFVKLIFAELLYEKPMFIFSIHTGGGMVGMFLTGCFASQAVVGLDGYSKIPDRTVGERLGWQMADAFAGFSYTFFTTMIILFGLKIILMNTRSWREGFGKIGDEQGRGGRTLQAKHSNMTPPEDAAATV